MTDASAWSRSGGRWLTGRPGGPYLSVTGAPAEQVERQLAWLAHAALPMPGPRGAIPGVEVLGERAALTGLSRGGTTSAGGASRLLPAGDGVVALSLPRPSDVELLPALVEADAEEPWSVVARWLKTMPAADAVDRARLLGLAAAVVPKAPEPLRRAAVVRTDGGGRERGRRVRVLDLSVLWAGPLCARLLGLLGADVVKVESPHRPDGARFGEPRFFDLLHAGHRSVTIDLTTREGVVELRRLIARSDVVLDSARPRALRGFGIDAERAVHDGAVWAAITAYGRNGDDAMAIGFGDDVAAGAGLVARDVAGPVFAADALADPLAGVQAAVAVVEALGRACGALLDVSMTDVARTAAHSRPGAGSEELDEPWPPQPGTPTGRAAERGQHAVDEVERDWPSD